MLQLALAYPNALGGNCFKVTQLPHFKLDFIGSLQLWISTINCRYEGVTVMWDVEGFLKMITNSRRSSSCWHWSLYCFFFHWIWILKSYGYIRQQAFIYNPLCQNMPSFFYINSFNYHNKLISGSVYHQHFTEENEVERWNKFSKVTLPIGLKTKIFIQIHSPQSLCN